MAFNRLIKINDVSAACTIFYHKRQELNKMSIKEFTEFGDEKLKFLLEFDAKPKAVCRPQSEELWACVCTLL